MLLFKSPLETALQIFLKKNPDLWYIKKHGKIFSSVKKWEMMCSNILSWARDKDKSLSHRQDLNLWPRSSVVRCMEGRFKSCRGLRFFVCPMLMTCWTHHFSNPSFVALSQPPTLFSQWNRRTTCSHAYQIEFVLFDQNSTKEVCLRRLLGNFLEVFCCQMQPT